MPLDAGEDDQETPSLPVELVGEILSRLSTADLLPALSVSAAWRGVARGCAAARRKPWLFLHSQRRRNPGALVTHAYDPHAGTWLRLPPPPPPPRPHAPSSAVGAVTGADLLFDLTPAALALRHGSLGAVWRGCSAPLAWRTDPVVAAVGTLLVLAGGTSDDDACAVEIHRLDGAAAVSAEPMPAALRDSPTKTFLSVAAGDRQLHVLERSSGAFCSFDVETRAWGPTKELRPDPSLCFSAIAHSDQGLLLAGLGLGGGGAATLRLWAVDQESLGCTLVGEMPETMARRLAGAGEEDLSSIDMIGVKNSVYIYRQSDPTAIFSGELAGGRCRWTEVEAPAAATANYPMDRFVFTCSPVGIDDLREAIQREEDQ